MICLSFWFEESTVGSILIYFCILMFAHLNSADLNNLESSLVPVCAKCCTQIGVIMFCAIIMFTEELVIFLLLILTKIQM